MNSTLKWIATSPNCSEVWSSFQQSKSEGQQNQLSQFPLSQSSLSKGPYRMTDPTKYDSSRPEGCLFYNFMRSVVTKDMSDMWIAKFGWNNASSSSIQSGELPIGASPKKNVDTSLAMLPFFRTRPRLVIGSNPPPFSNHLSGPGRLLTGGQVRNWESTKQSQTSSGQKIP